MIINRSWNSLLAHLLFACHTGSGDQPIWHLKHEAEPPSWRGHALCKGHPHFLSFQGETDCWAIHALGPSLGGQIPRAPHIPLATQGIKSQEFTFCPWPPRDTSFCSFRLGGAYRSSNKTIFLWSYWKVLQMYLKDLVGIEPQSVPPLFKWLLSPLSLLGTCPFFHVFPTFLQLCQSSIPP